MDKEFKFWLGTVVSYILIILYAVAVFIMIYKPGVAVPEDGVGIAVTGIETITTLIGGLISALVISILAVSETDPIEKLIGTKSKKEIKAYMIYVYALVWLSVGVLALVKGTVLNDVPESFLSTVSDLGTAWLATAVASAYAYLGINPSSS